MLGLGDAVRAFNEKAVPGMGGVWFAKQLLLSLLGISVAEKAREAGIAVTNIETANAIEALACALALTRNGWQGDSRLRGVMKLRDKQDWRFGRVRRSGFYVTQPMRTATHSALLALGLVESPNARFNAFRCAREGEALLAPLAEEACYYNQSVRQYLLRWCGGENISGILGNDRLAEVLSPLGSPKHEIRSILEERLIQGGRNEGRDDTERRRTALAWVRSLDGEKRPLEISWDMKPRVFGAEHWRDLMAGAYFSELRDSTLAVLDVLEQTVAASTTREFDLRHSIPDLLEQRIAAIRDQAKQFAQIGRGLETAKTFAQECIIMDSRALLKSLVGRDGRVLRLQGDLVRPGPAFQPEGTRAPEEEEEDDDMVMGVLMAQEAGVRWPSHISHRIDNLLLLSQDLKGNLTAWLGQETGRAGDRRL